MVNPVRFHVLEWLKLESDRYTDPKWEDTDSRPLHDEKLREGSCGRDSWWWDEITHYLHRAQVLGLDTRNGRQAAMKGLRVYLSLGEAIYRVHGDLSEPGLASGEQVE